MRISIIGPGYTQIPPIGWGAVEILIWDMSQALKQLGHEVQIINTVNPNEMIANINQFSPDFVHIQYDDYVVLCPYIQYPCAVTSHFGYVEQLHRDGGYKQRVFDQFASIKPNVFGLSEGILDVYRNLAGIPDENLFLTPNGVNLDTFRKTLDPKYGDRSIYLAKIDHRKRQWLFQRISSLYFAGNIDPSSQGRFDEDSENYLGEWSKKQLHQELTDYGNLVLLSDGEAHPLVCMEALSAGLGVVVTEWGKANLDLSKEYITVIPEWRINDTEYIEKVIIENREVSLQNRKDILEYSQQFDWKNVIEKYHLPFMKQIING
jgi:glycosyltransferase involved in cell wall biosynthesis